MIPLLGNPSNKSQKIRKRRILNKGNFRGLEYEKKIFMLTKKIKRMLFVIA
jgi:hypothetical protein